MSAADELEPIGDLKFDALDFVGLGPTNDEWCAKQVPWLEAERMGRVFLRMNDEEMAARIRESDDPEATAGLFMDTCEALIERKQWYDAGAEMMDAALRRIMIVVERTCCDEQGEAGGAS